MPQLRSKPSLGTAIAMVLGFLTARGACANVFDTTYLLSRETYSTPTTGTEYEYRIHGITASSGSYELPVIFQIKRTKQLFDHQGIVLGEMNQQPVAFLLDRTSQNLYLLAGNSSTPIAALHLGKKVQAISRMRNDLGVLAMDADETVATHSLSGGSTQWAPPHWLSNTAFPVNSFNVVQIVHLPGNRMALLTMGELMVVEFVDGLTQPRVPARLDLQYNQQVQVPTMGPVLIKEVVQFKLQGDQAWIVANCSDGAGGLRAVFLRAYYSGNALTLTDIIPTNIPVSQVQLLDVVDSLQGIYVRLDQDLVFLQTGQLSPRVVVADPFSDATLQNAKVPPFSYVKAFHNFGKSLAAVQTQLVLPSLVGPVRNPAGVYSSPAPAATPAPVAAATPAPPAMDVKALAMDYLKERWNKNQVARMVRRPTPLPSSFSPRDLSYFANADSELSERLYFASRHCVDGLASLRVEFSGLTMYPVASVKSGETVDIAKLAEYLGQHYFAEQPEIKAKLAGSTMNATAKSTKTEAELTKMGRDWLEEQWRLARGPGATLPAQFRPKDFALFVNMLPSAKLSGAFEEAGRRSSDGLEKLHLAFNGFTMVEARGTKSTGMLHIGDASRFLGLHYFAHSADCVTQVTASAPAKITSITSSTGNSYLPLRGFRLPP